MMYDEYLNEFRNVSKDLQKFHYDEKHNLKFSRKSLSIVYGKAGTYIINLALMVFMEKFISGYLLLIHCYEIEMEMKEDALSGN